ncbi:flagellar hook capping FlgD N-terminal domain-containing protein [Pseudomonas panipatensis]|uniref:Basal-body rod modification protein FlgD n=1 Tax=Pseudomonas panipatensis TaxID=428992 RepID=A0A1G8FR79_9PSED|nr:flagellar hook capping FlgD N-terminal domain-containing protein [Pseudomonas panipatensis]SDH84604.1 flagellar basal-body rod modification protein FlgD [Pseudomonas panipatensis]SMP52555.1 flagellar basal-body rod modification protein FlgD [Pseudomonas panipatensis]
MSSVTGTSGTSAASQSSDSGNPSANLTDVSQLQNNFISLMVAQIQYQDPTNPVDSTQFVNQYSQLSQVKSLENLNTIQKNSLVLADNLQNLSAAGLVGHQVMVSADSLQLDSAVVGGQAQLEHASSTTTLQLTSAATGEVSEVALGPQDAGSVSFSIDPQALGLAPGKYSVAIKTSSGETPKVEIGGKVSHVRVSNNGPVLEVDGVGTVPFYNIVEFGSSAA